NQTMHASVKKDSIKKYENLLEEGLYKIITNFSVTHNGVSFTDIHEGKQYPDFLIDIVGQIVEIGDVEILNINRKQTKRLTMTLRDDGYHFIINLL
ncbi:unnamed protein product, partial [Thlaspi arvense]